jgi:integrating conjugative element protein (TIGR03757 family)
MLHMMVKRNRRGPCVWLVSLVLFADATCADPRGPNPPPVIEVFTSAERPLVETDANDSGGDWQGLAITVYEIDGIQSLERELSLDLPVEPQPSKAMVLKRLQRLNAPTRARMQSAATGLSKTLQYGVERYPAVVFDGEAVVYGLTDLNIALEQYQIWKTGRQP